MNIAFNETLFGPLWPYIQDENITDIKWNGRCLWVDDLSKGRYIADTLLDEDFIKIFTSKIAVNTNVNFNRSHPSLMAETPELRIHATHPSINDENCYIIAIRKTPAVARINDKTVIETNYATELTQRLLKNLVHNECSGIVIGDVGAGKTELIKYLSSAIPDNLSTMTVEDTLEMKLPVLYPYKDVTSVKTDENYTTELAIRDALRLMTKYLIIAEARGREITRIIEGASTGCVAWTTIHTNNVWEIPDRVVQMAGKEIVGDSFENDVFTFFDVGIKVKKSYLDTGISRSIDQICFFSREDGQNRITVFMKNGLFTGEPIPASIREKIENEIQLMHMIENLGKEK